VKPAADKKGKQDGNKQVEKEKDQVKQHRDRMKCQGENVGRKQDKEKRYGSVPECDHLTFADKH
jgi:hypothetical protein